MAFPKHPRKFEEGFKRQIVQPCDNGRTPKDIKSEYDIGSSTLHRWARSTRENGSTRARDNRTPEQERVPGLERENKRLRMEVDVLKTAAPMFARR